MEKPQIETPKSLVAFPPHRKSHLKSETYRTLVRIISQCYDHHQIHETAQIPPQQLTPDNSGNELGQASEKEVRQHNELVSPDGEDHDTSQAQKGVVVDENFEATGFRDRGFSDTQVVINEIENIMRIEEDGELVEQKDLMVDDNSHGTGLHDGGFDQAQKLLIDELEHIMKGNEEFVCDNNCKLVTTPLEENQSGSDAVAFSNSLEEHADLQPIVVEERRCMGQQKVDGEHWGQNICECLNLSLDKSMTNKVSKPGDESEDKSSLCQTHELGVHHEMQQKEIEVEKPVCASGPMSSPNHMIEDGEMEEGEVSGDFEMDDRSVSMFPEDVVLLEQKKVNKTQVSEDIIDKNKFSFNEKNEANKKESASTSFMVAKVDNSNNSEVMYAKESVRSDMVCKRKVVVYEDPLLAKKTGGHKKQKKGRRVKEQKKGCGAQEHRIGNIAKNGIDHLGACPNNLSLDAENLEHATGSQGFPSKEKDAALCNKKKRGPPSEEKKAKKKQKQRKKRAEKNRELGVKRLKLRPVLNPKPVTICHHYLKGKCWEGEKCKFSHDTIPLTKSKPCCHFARGSCMKGDDCPYDHELSKYACDNYTKNGFCSRGENCKFSHKLLSTEDSSSTPNVCTPDLKPPSMPGSSISKQLDISGTSHQTAKALPDSLGVISCKNTGQNVVKGVLNLPALVPKGIRALSGGKSLMDESRNEDDKVRNQMDHNASGTTQNSSETPKGTPPAVAPKGINFLSFGKSPLEYSSTMKLPSLSINRGDGVKSLLSNNFSVKQARSSPNMDRSIQVGKEASQNASNMTPRLNGMVQKNELAAAALKPNLFSLGEALTDSSRRNSETSLPFDLGGVVDRSVQASKITSNKHQNLNAIPWGLPASPLDSGQSSDHLALACLKNSPNSAQKALMSTLAFAAKVESEMKTNRSAIGGLAGGSEVSKETGVASTSGGSKNDPTKAAKILDFLSTIGGRTKQ